MLNQTPQHFDYTAAAREAGLDDTQIASLEHSWEKEYPHDPVLRELHLLRTAIAIRDGLCTFDDAVAPQDDANTTRTR